MIKDSNDLKQYLIENLNKAEVYPVRIGLYDGKNENNYAACSLITEIETNDDWKAARWSIDKLVMLLEELGYKFLGQDEKILSDGTDDDWTHSINTFYWSKGISGLVFPADTKPRKNTNDLSKNKAEIVDDSDPGTIRITNDADLKGLRSRVDRNTVRTIIIGKDVTKLREDEFSSYINLKNVFFEKDSNLTIIDYGAFKDCNSLEKIRIPASVIKIGTDVFLGCTSLKEISVDESNPKFDSRENCNAIIETEKNRLRCACRTTIIPESVKAIYDGAFFGIPYLEQIRIPSSVTKIGNNVFGHCRDLKEITVDERNKKFDSRNGCNAIIETKKGILVCACNKTVIPDGIKEIGAHAFFGCREIEEIVIPDGVEVIGISAFYGCSALKRITLPSSVREISYNPIPNEATIYAHSNECIEEYARIYKKKICII